ncbi:MAG: substrate-binding domain-containing protein [Propionibacteriaceae bacterium]|nr:substrate-binding domain-containing protein [Propionibacteriaceae bacterium]
MAATLLSGCSAQGSETSAGGGNTTDRCADGTGAIGLIPKLGTDPYMVVVKESVEAAAQTAGNEVIYTSPSDASGAAQIPFVNQLVAQGVCAIAIAGSDPESTKEVLKAARDQGIKVLSWDSDIDPDARSVFVNQADSASLGDQMLVAMNDMLGAEGGEIAILSSTPTAVNQNAWIASIKEKIETDPAYSKLTLATVVYGQEKADENARQATALVQSYPNLKGIIVPAGIGLPAAANALEQTGDLGRIKLTGLAPASTIKKYIVSGEVRDVWWSVPDLGTLTYYAAVALMKGEITGAEGDKFSAGSLGEFTVGKNGEVLLGEGKIVTAENVDDFPF